MAKKVVKKAAPKKKAQSKKIKTGEDFQDKQISQDEKYLVVADTIPAEETPTSDISFEEGKKLWDESNPYQKLKEAYPQVADEDLTGTPEDIAARVSAKLGVAYSDIISLIH